MSSSSTDSDSDVVDVTPESAQREVIDLTYYVTPEPPAIKQEARCAAPHPRKVGPTLEPRPDRHPQVVLLARPLGQQLGGGAPCRGQECGLLL